MAKRKITLEEIESLNCEKVASLLYDMLDGNKELYGKLDKLILSANPKELIKAIKKDIASIKRGSKFIDYYNAFEFSQKIQHIVDDIVLMVEDKKIASKLFQELILTDSKVYLRSDDSSGVIQTSYRHCLKGWFSCVEFMSENELYSDMKEMLVCEGFGTRDIFSEVIPRTVLIRLYDEYFLLQNHLNIDRDDRVCLLKETAHHLKEPKRFINALKLNREAFKDYELLEIAKEYQYANMPKELLEQLQKVQEISSYNSRKFYELQVWAYSELQEPLNIILAYKNWYEKSKEISVLKAYLLLLDEEMYQKVKNEALLYAKSLSLGEALEFFYALDETELANNYIFENQENLHQSHLHDAQLKIIARWLEKEYPQALILLYRSGCEQALSQSISKHYPKGIKALKACLKLEQQYDSSSWRIESNKVYMQRLIEKHKKKSKFVELFNTI
jgi:hypothetical protein